MEEEWPIEGRCAHLEDHVPISVGERHGEDLGDAGLSVGILALRPPQIRDCRDGAVCPGCEYVSPPVRHF